MRVYIAGSYSDDNIIGVLNNIHAGIKVGAELVKKGYDVFCPFLDYQFHFFDKTLKKEDYQRNSMAWVEASDVIFVLPNSETSRGTLREIQRASKLKIPVCFDLKKLESIRLEYEEVDDED